MRIGIDGRLWNETGVGRYIRNLVKQLQILDHENEYVLFVRNDSWENVKIQITNAKWKIVRADIRWHSFAEQWEMPKILERENLDLVHFPYFNVPIFYNKPFVVTIHDLIINHFPTGRATTLPWPLYQIKRLGYKMALSHAIKNSQKIISVSEATKEEIVDHFGVDPEKVVVTYEAGELEINKNHEPASPAGGLRIMNHGVKKPYILYVGNAHPHKNLERLLEAFQKLKSQNSKLPPEARLARGGKTTAQNLKLILVGKEDYFYQRLERKVEEMDLRDGVVFYGEAADSELRELYKNAEALILPSLMEGFGLPALEAMGQGCLVLCSDIPAFREICKDAAIYFDPLSIADMADKMEKVIHYNCDQLDKPKAQYNNIYHYSELIKKGFERAKMFSWEKMAQETLKVYEDSNIHLKGVASISPFRCSLIL